MEINGHWKSIKKLFKKTRGNYAVATVNEDGTPHITPIGSIILRDDCTGFFFDHYSLNMKNNLERNPRVCIMAVNFSKPFWFVSFVLGKYTSPPAVRLMGEAGPKRKATSEEMKQFNNILWVWLFKHLKLKGYERGWKPLTHVRDIKFDSFEPVHAGIMTQGHWRL